MDAQPSTIAISHQPSAIFCASRYHATAVS
jgi:hypothetical protein